MADKGSKLLGTLSGSVLLLVLAAVGACIVGWVLNIVALVAEVTANSPIGALLIGRIVGIFFAPLGVLLGYFA